MFMLQAWAFSHFDWVFGDTFKAWDEPVPFLIDNGQWTIEN